MTPTHTPIRKPLAKKRPPVTLWVHEFEVPNSCGGTGWHPDKERIIADYRREKAEHVDPPGLTERGDLVLKLWELPVPREVTVLLAKDQPLTEQEHDVINSYVDEKVVADGGPTARLHACYVYIQELTLVDFDYA